MDTSAVSAVEICLSRIEWQSTIFSSVPRRSELLQLKHNWPLRRLRIRVHRNQTFELVAAAMLPLMRFAGFEADFQFSDYDDSLNFDLAEPADLEIVWLDFERYRIAHDSHELVDWIRSRLRALRAGSLAPILVADGDTKDEATARFGEHLAALAAEIPGLHVAERGKIRDHLGDSYASDRLAAISGSRITDSASVLLARELALTLIPQALEPPLKAIAVDLDDTLYAGVLAEDGPEGVALTPAHAELQSRLATAAQNGIYVALLSKNDPSDVDQLFQKRQDFPIGRDALSAQAIGWQSKSTGLRQIAEKLRIATDAMLVIDDNLGELANLANTYPGLQILYAGSDVEQTARALSLFPRLKLEGHGNADHLRAIDLAAAVEREAIEKDLDGDHEYLKSLQIRLHLRLNPRDEIERLHQLSTKTTQFNLALQHLNAAEIAQWMEHSDQAAAGIWLNDRLADSGLIAAVFGRRDGKVLRIHELCVSCRALGRRLESAMIYHAINCLVERLPAERVAFFYDQGRRNGPARRWLEEFAGSALKAGLGCLEMAWPQQSITNELRDLPICVNLETNHDA